MFSGRLRHGLWSSAFVGLIAVLLCPGCGGSNTGAGKTPSLPQLVELNRAALEAFPERPYREDLKEVLLNAALADGAKNSLESNLAVIMIIPDVKFSSSLMDAVELELKKIPEEDAVRTLKELWTRCPDSRAGARAADLYLDAARTEDSAALSARVEEILRIGNNTKSAFVARLRRVNRLRETGEIKGALPDAIHLLADFPQKVVDLGKLPFLAGTFELGGYQAEAWVLKGSSSDATEFSRFLLTELTLAGENEESLPTIAMGPAGRYYQQPATFAATQEQPNAPVGSVTDSQRAIGAARASFLALSQHDIKVLNATARELLSTASTIDVSIEPFENVNALRILTAALQDALQSQERWHQSFHTQNATAPKFFATQEYADVKSSVSEAESKLLNRLLEDAGTHHPEVIMDRVHLAVDFSLKTGRPEDAIQALQFIPTRFPDSPSAPLSLAELSDYYLLRKRDKSKAAETLQALLEKYPTEPNRARNILKLTSILCEDGKSEEAYEFCQDFVHAYPNHALRPHAELLMAISLGAMGAFDEADHTAASVAAEFPDSVYAPRALMWQATHRLAAQRYDDARTVLETLTSAYPKAAEIEKANSILTSLKNASTMTHR